MATWAAIVAGGIALLLAFEAWSSLQYPPEARNYPLSILDLLAGVALPLVAVGLVILGTWTARRLSNGRRSGKRQRG